MIAVDNNLIDKLAADRRVSTEFPFLRLSKPGSGCCGRALPKKDYDAIKLALANLPAHGKRKLKDLLKASQMVIYHPGPGGTVVETRF